MPKIDPGHGGRSVEEWIGASPDAVPPERVRLRVFRRFNGMCYLSGRKIMPGEDWQLEHIKPLNAGGGNRESNLAPALTAPHKAKTKREMAEKKVTDKIAKKHLGIKPEKKKIPAPLKAAKPPSVKLPMPKPRAIYKDK